MKSITHIALVTLFGSALAAPVANASEAWAVPPGVAGAEIAGSGPPSPPPFLMQLFQPKLIMENQSEIELRPAQVKAIKEAMTAAQAKLVELQWDLAAAAESLDKLVAKDKVDESAALKKLEQVSALEQKMKTVNLTLLIRIKNVLDADQQSKLRSLRVVRPFGGPPGPAAGPMGMPIPATPPPPE